MSALTPTRVLGPQFPPAWHRPWLRYFAPVEGEGGGGDGTPKDDDLGFPKETPVDQMTPEQQAAYWKHQSKVQQKAREDAEKATSAYRKFGTPEELQSAHDAAEQKRQADLSEADRALEQAKAAAKAEGIAEAGARNLGPAITGWLVAHVKGANESIEDATARVAGAIAFADLTKFVGDNGELDAEKVQTFARSIGSADSGGDAAGGFTLFDAMQRQNVPAPGSTGSVDALEQQTYDRLTSKK